MHLHNFMARVNAIVSPVLYLEIGVQHGTSLALAKNAERAWGVDPMPLTSAQRNQTIFTMTSDAFFAEAADGRGTHMSPDAYRIREIDLGFIDGLHHYEQALRDFRNMETYVHNKSVIVFDDVLPRNQAEAHRDMCPGDWTGDVWKVTQILLRFRPELRIVEVNTQPTGTLMVWDFLDSPQQTPWDDIERIALADYMNLTTVPDNVLDRSYAIDPEEALAELEGFLGE